jgi:RNA polymerase sigma-70 factor (ECF subfamily)
VACAHTNFTDRPSGDSPDDDEFVRLFVQYQRVLFAYLRTALGSPADAEEVLQETSVILWRERRQFVAGTNFVNWATTVAQNQVRKFRRTRKHVPHQISDELLDQMAGQIVSQTEWIAARHAALEQCLETLAEHERRLIGAGYGAKINKKATAEHLGMTPNRFYKALNRIRQRLLKCIERRLTSEDRS